MTKTKKIEEKYQEACGLDLQNMKRKIGSYIIQIPEN